MTGQEMRLWEATIQTLLQGTYWRATVAEAETFVNDIRVMLHGKIMITEGSGPTISIQFPPSLAEPLKAVKPNGGDHRAKKAAAQVPVPDAVPEAVPDVAEVAVD